MNTKQILINAFNLIDNAKHEKFTHAEVRAVLEQIRNEVLRFESVEKKGLDKKEPVTKPPTKEKPPVVKK